MSAFDYGVIVKTPSGEILTGDIEIYLEEENITLEPYKTWINFYGGKASEETYLGCYSPYEDFVDKKGNIKEVFIHDIPATSRILNKYNDRNRFQLKIKGYTIEYGFGVPESREEYTYLSTKTRRKNTIYSYTRGGYYERLTKSKHRPYDWTNRDVKHYKQYFK